MAMTTRENCKKDSVMASYEAQILLSCSCAYIDMRVSDHILYIF